MALIFGNWFVSGNRAAVMTTKHYITRNDLVIGAMCAIDDKLGLFEPTDEQMIAAATKIGRGQIETTLRSLLETRGSIVLESADNPTMIAGYISDRLRVVSEALVDVRFPEANQ